MATTHMTPKDEIVARELCSALQSRYPDAAQTGDLGVIVRQALADDPHATADDIAAILDEAIADAADSEKCESCGNIGKPLEIDAITGESICATCRMDRADFRADHPDRPRG